MSQASAGRSSAGRPPRSHSAPRPVRLRPAAQEDIAATAEHTRTDSGPGIALAFTDAVQRALTQIARDPALGSPAHAQALDLPGLRAWPLRRFAHVVFYMQRGEEIDVWRVLHGKRDLPPGLRIAVEG